MAMYEDALIAKHGTRPGTAIAALLEKHGFTQHGCACSRLQMKLDVLGSKVLREQIFNLKKEMVSSITDWRQQNSIHIGKAIALWFEIGGLSIPNSYEDIAEKLLLWGIEHD